MIDPSDIPARLDRLPWSWFHWRVTIALGVTWALDGLEVTLAGTFAGALQRSPSLHMDAASVGISASAYLAGAVLGALLLGYLADAFGRKRLYSITLGIYLAGAIVTVLSGRFASFAVGRCITGVGIGGEYAAINSAIQEFTPPRIRGRVDLIVNGSFWAGAMASGAAAGVLQTPTLLDNDLGWRIAFGIGAILGFVVLLLRRYVPESPRWLVARGRRCEAEAVLRAIEAKLDEGIVETHSGSTPTPRIGRVDAARLRSAVHALANTYRNRTVLGLALMAAQAFCYNAIFFSYAVILTTFYGISSQTVGWYILPFAFGNLSGPLLLGPLFDTLGRKVMITATYAMAGLLLAVTGVLFRIGVLGPTTQVIAWSLTFFVASAAASAAYLTVGESFPLGIRALAIAFFYAVGTLLGGVAGPAIFGVLIANNSRDGILLGYLFGGALMVGAAIVEWAIGIAAEYKSLEALTTPPSSIDFAARSHRRGQRGGF